MERTRRDFAVDVVLSMVWLALSWRTIHATGPEPLSIAISALIVARTATAALFFLIRRPSTAISDRASDWLIGLAGTLVPLLYTPGVVAVPMRVAVFLFMLSSAAMLLSVLATVGLGRSFGIVPANRGIKSSGFYRFVRHPLYGLYLIQDTTRLLIGPTPWNLSIYLAFVILTWRRAASEERLLLHDVDYQKYAAGVRWRFVPGLA